MKEYYTTYDITNIIDSKWYFGVHGTNKLNDNYLGSGTHIKNAVKKYGPGNFLKVVNGVWKSEKIAYLIEEWIVDVNVVNDSNNYNQISGGIGGARGVASEATKRLISENHHDVSGENNPMYGKFGKLHPTYNSTWSTDRRERVNEFWTIEERAKRAQQISDRAVKNRSTIKIFSGTDVLMFICKQSFPKFCKKHNLPFGQLQQSYLNNKKLYISNGSFGNAKTEYKKFRGWYAIKL